MWQSLGWQSEDTVFFSIFSLNESSWRRTTREISSLLSGKNDNRPQHPGPAAQRHCGNQRPGPSDNRKANKNTANINDPLHSKNSLNAFSAFSGAMNSSKPCAISSASAPALIV